MRHAVRSVLVLIAVGMILLGWVFVALELFKYRMGHGPLVVWRCVVFLLVAAAGVVLAWKSGAIAREIADHFDE